MTLIDLHVHSNISDGSMKPSEVVQLAAKTGLGAITLSDHESIDGLDEAEKEVHEQGIGFLPGMEASVQYDPGRRLHIVCLGFDRENEDFKRMYKKVRAVKESKMEELCAGIRAKGIDITVETLKKYTTTGRFDRYTVMRYLVTLGLYEKAQPLWDNYINPVIKELGLDKEIPYQEVFDAVHAAGGITSLAHFHKNLGLKGMTREEQETAIARLHEQGLDGMERWYPNYSDEDAEFAGYLIDKYNLVPTGGTDFHGANRKQVALGTGIEGNMHVPFSFFENISSMVRCYIQPK